MTDNKQKKMHMTQNGLQTSTTFFGHSLLGTILFAPAQVCLVLLVFVTFRGMLQVLYPHYHSVFRQKKMPVKHVTVCEASEMKIVTIVYVCTCKNELHTRQADDSKDANCA